MSSDALSYKQPKGLYLLFFTELWERFGFYTLQALLILYMVHQLKYSDSHANYVYAAFSALLYLTPTIGGYIADRYMGFQQAIIVGGILLALGYVFTAMPGQHLFYFGLAILVCANGLFKPNVSSIVGTLYEENDARRDGGFTLFYMGINIGSLVPPLIAGGVVAMLGWHAGFGMAAIGMVVGMITFFLGKKSLGHHGTMPESSPLRSKSGFIGFYLIFALAIIATIIISDIALNYPHTTSNIVEIGAVIIFAVVLYFLSKEKKAQRNKMIASLILIAISIGFWALYNQTFTSLTLFADRNMVPHLGNIPLDAEAMQFFNPLFIIALSPMLSRLWISMARKNKTFSIPAKFSYGVLLMSLGFLLLGIGGSYFAHNGLNSPWWLIISYLLQTIGELLLSPIGLAMITVLSPKRLVGMMMGIWFFAQAAAFALGGDMANLAAVPKGASVTQSLALYTHAFWLFGWLSIGLTVVSFLLVPLLKRMIGSAPVRIES